MIYRVDILQQFGAYRVVFTASTELGSETIATAKSATEPRGEQIRAWLRSKGFEPYGPSRIVGSKTLRTMVREI